MEPPVYSRNSAFAWPMKPEDSPSRCSSYSMKFPVMRSNEYDALKPASSSYVHWNRDNISPASSFSWQQTPGMMFSYPTGLPHMKEEPSVYRYPSENHYTKGSNVLESITPSQAGSEQAAFSNSSESNNNGAHINRPAKRHVKSACFNCKKAHLSCDEARPCTRCKQGGKIDGCYDVVQRRKGRPRLAHTNGRNKGRDGVTKPLTAKPLMMAQDPRTLNSFPFFDFYPDMSFIVDNCNDCSQAPVAFLDMSLHLVRTNQPFKGLFNYLGDIDGCKLEHLIETVDMRILEGIRWALRQELEMIMAQSGPHLKSLESPDAGRLPSPDSQDSINNIYKTPVKQEQIHFRLGDGQSRPIPVEFGIARTTVAFVTMTLPPLRNSSSMIPSYQQRERGNLHPLQSPYGQAFDSMRSYYGRPMDRAGPLPSPDSSSYFSVSPSTSSFSFSSAGSSALSTTSRHPSIASHRSSYDIPFSSSANPNIQAPPVANIALNSPNKQNPPSSSLVLPQAQGFRPASAQLAPLQDRDQSLLNSRRLPPIPGLGSSATGSQEASGADSRNQQNTWPSPDSDGTSQGDKKFETWRNENSTGNRSRLDVKELAG